MKIGTEKPKCRIGLCLDGAIMIRLLFLFLLYKYSCSAELAACDEDSHCPSNFYCDRTAFGCRQCLRCEEFGRSPPSSSTVCVTSVVECGSCLEGLDYAQDNVKEKCENRHDATQELLPIYVWVIVAACIVGVLYLIVHFLRATRILNKFVYSITCTATQTPQRTASNEMQQTTSALLYPGASTVLYPGCQQVQNQPVPDGLPLYHNLYPTLESEPLMHDRDEIPKEPVITTISRSYDRESHHTAVVFNKANYENDPHPINNLQPSPNVESLDVNVSQLDGNLQNDTDVDVESGALVVQNPGTSTAPDTPSTSTSSVLANVTCPVVVPNSSIPTVTTAETSTNAEDSCSSMVVNQVTCAFSTAADQDNASTILVQNMNIVQVKKNYCRKSRSTF